VTRNQTKASHGTLLQAVFPNYIGRESLLRSPSVDSGSLEGPLMMFQLGSAPQVDHLASFTVSAARKKKVTLALAAAKRDSSPDAPKQTSFRSWLLRPLSLA